MMSLLPIVLKLTFLMGLTTAWVYMERESKGVHYRTSNYGRFFLVAFPQLGYKRPDNKFVKIVFMTFQRTCTVVTLVPKPKPSQVTSYKVTELQVTATLPAVQFVDNNQQVYSMTGMATRIMSNGDISVQASYYIKSNAVVVIPPVETYATEYHMVVFGDITFFMTIAVHEMTKVVYEFDKDSYSAKKCSWNSYCGKGKTTTIYLNGSQYSMVGPVSSKGSIGGTHILADKPVLVLSGGSDTGHKQTSIMTYPATYSWTQGYFGPNTVGDAWPHFIYGSITEGVECKTSCCNYSPTQTGSCGKTKATNTTWSTNMYGGALNLDGFNDCELRCDRPTPGLLYADHVTNQKFAYELVPVQNWASIVQFKVPELPNDHPLTRKLFVYSNVNDTSHFLYDDANLTNKATDWSQVGRFSNSCHVTSRKLKDGEYFTIRSTDPRHSFVAYAMGIESKREHYIGWGSGLGRYFFTCNEHKGKHPCVKMSTFPKPGDEIDNDCDGRFDEEKLDGKDDDGDKLIDEDTYLERVDGVWQPWQPWSCSANCKGKGKNVRHRGCSDAVNFGKPCGYGTKVGASEDSKVCERTDRIQCDLPCPAGFYGAWCDATCPTNCENKACDRKSGVCFGCKTGYKHTDFCDEKEPDVLPVRHHPEKKPEGITILIIIPILLMLLVSLFIAGNEYRLKKLEDVQPDEEAIAPTDDDDSVKVHFDEEPAVDANQQELGTEVVEEPSESII